MVLFTTIYNERNENHGVVTTRLAFTLAQYHGGTDPPIWWNGKPAFQAKKEPTGKEVSIKSCLSSATNTPPNPPNANSFLHCFTPMFTHLELFAWVFWMRKRDGVQQSLWSKCCWGFRIYWILPTPIVLLNLRLTIFSSTIRMSIREEWRRKLERIHPAHKYQSLNEIGRGHDSRIVSGAFWRLSLTFFFFQKSEEDSLSLVSECIMVATSVLRRREAFDEKHSLWI